MSKKHPIISITGPSGAGKTVVKKYIYNFVKSQSIPTAIIEGDSFHRYNRSKMLLKQKESRQFGRVLTHYSHLANNLKELESLLKQYSIDGTGKRRYYVHNEKEAKKLSKRFQKNFQVGDLTPLEDLPEQTHLLFYEGLHGAAVDEELNFDVAKYVDLKIGIVPTINLEWKQKLHRDTVERGYHRMEVIDSITERLPDYIDFIIPQFSRTNINLQRIPLLDSSNPFDQSEDIKQWQVNSQIVVHLRDMEFSIENLQHQIVGSKIIDNENILLPGNAMEKALEFIVTPIIQSILKNRN